MKRSPGALADTGRVECQCPVGTSRIELRQPQAGLYVPLAVGPDRYDVVVPLPLGEGSQRAMSFAMA